MASTRLPSLTGEMIRDILEGVLEMFLFATGCLLILG